MSERERGGLILGRDRQTNRQTGREVGGVGGGGGDMKTLLSPYYHAGDLETNPDEASTTTWSQDPKNSTYVDQLMSAPVLNCRTE